MTAILRRYARQQQELGYRTFYLPEPSGPARTAPRQPEPSPALADAPAGPTAGKTVFAPASLSDTGKREALLNLYARHKACARCRLHTTRNKFVFGSGNPDARLMFVGEAPGADEDREGKPFVGAAGQLLTKMIEGGMQLPRSEVFIANILKCRPPGNRDPEPAERDACTPILLEQIRIIAPQYLCCLGRHAGRFLLKLPDDTSLRSMRGRFYDLGGIKVLVTYHPSALLREPERKRDAWDDLKLLMRDMGLAIPGPQ